MSYTFTSNMIPLVIAGLISGLLGVYTWRNRKTAGATPFSIMMFILFEWSMCYILELAGTDIPTKMFWIQWMFVGVVATPVAWFVFALEYTGRKTWLNPIRLILLSILPTITMGVILTNDAHQLFWTTRELVFEGGFLLLFTQNGWYFWVHAAYTYALIMIGLVVIIRALLRWPPQYRGQMGWIVLATLAPLIANAITIFQLLPILIDLTPFAFTITGLGMAFAIFRHRLLDIAPIARDVIIENLRDGIIVTDSNYRIVDINEAAQGIIGISGKDQPVGKPLGELLARWPELVEHYRNVLEADDEINIQNGDQTEWYELNLSTLQDEGNSIIGRVIIVRNITDRKLAERQIQESEARFRQIVEHASDVIYRTDLNGYFTYANPAALRAMGFEKEEEVLGKFYLDLTTPETRHKLKRTYQHQFASRTENTYHEFPGVAMDGNQVWFGQNVQLIYEHDQVVGFQALARDITAIRQAQESLRIARDQALEASRAKSQLLSKVSHELRTPLGGILGYAELLQNNAFGEMNPRQKKAVGEVVESAVHLTEMVNELLDEAQLRSSTTTLQEKNFALLKMIQSAVAGLEVLAQKKGLTFSIQIDPNLPQEIYGDERRIRQIVINLIGNAIKYTEKGSVSLMVSKPDSNHWEIQVKDTGIGIPKEAQRSIFEPFQQVNPMVTPDNRGVGLGLSITKQLIDLMHGRIVVESEIGKGTNFIVLLPIIKPG